jgi:hypothetical protein
MVVECFKGDMSKPLLLSPLPITLTNFVIYAI